MFSTIGVICLSSISLLSFLYFNLTLTYPLSFNELIILDTLSCVTLTIFAIYLLLAKQLLVSSLKYKIIDSIIFSLSDKSSFSKISAGIHRPFNFCISYPPFVWFLFVPDFTTYETAYDTFFNLYGYKLVKEYVPYSYNQNGDYIDDIKFREIIKDIYDVGNDRFIEWQDNFRKCVDFVYNLNGNEELKDEENRLTIFIAYTIKDNDFYTYSQDIEIVTDNYINIHHNNSSKTLKELIKRINDKDSKLELHNVYTSTKLTSICFAVLDQIVRHDNLQIKTCLNCGRYFIPSYRQSEIYCDLVNIDNLPTCKEKGAGEQWKKNLESNKSYALYRRIYRQKFMIAQRKKNDKNIQKEFNQWKKDAKEIMNKLKKEKLSEDEVYNWLIENK